MSHPCDIYESRFLTFLSRFGTLNDTFQDTDVTGVRQLRNQNTNEAVAVTKLPEEKPAGHWVQTERAAHEAWAALLRNSPRAAELMHLLVARMGDHNAVVVSQGTLATLMGRNRRTVIRALDTLVEENWIRSVQIGDRGTVNAYVINDQVAWRGKREGMRYSLFSATVVIAEEEQAKEVLEALERPLRALPTLFPGEQQLPSGEGLAPPSEPTLPSLEPDLPTRR